MMMDSVSRFGLSSMEKLITSLKWLYAFVLLVVPVYSVIFLHTNPEALEIMSAWNLTFLQSSYYLVVIFSMFALFLLREFLPDTLPGILDVLIAPFVIIGLQALVSPISASEYLAIIGMLHIITIMSGFILLIGYICIMGIVGMIIEKKWDWDALLGILVTCGAQLLFIIPGAGAMYIFVKYIYIHDILGNSPNGTIWHWSALFIIASYIFSIINTTGVFGKRLKRESIAGY